VSDIQLTLPASLVEAIADQVVERIKQTESETRTDASPWLDFTAACDYLGFSRDKLYKLSAARALPVRKKQDGQGLLFHREELNEWLRGEYPRLDRLR
jgi:excisionase family DNA binding protein